MPSWSCTALAPQELAPDGDEAQSKGSIGLHPLEVRLVHFLHHHHLHGPALRQERTIYGSCIVQIAQAQGHQTTSTRTSLPHVAMKHTPPRYPIGHRVNIINCALCGRRRSSRYRSSLDPEPLVCSKCVRASALPKVVIDLILRGDGYVQSKPDTPHVSEISPTETRPRPIELPAGERDRSYSRHRGHHYLPPIEEEAPLVDRSTKPRSYRGA